MAACLQKNAFGFQSMHTLLELGGLNDMSNDNHTKNANGKETRTELALQASELSYRRLFEAAQDGILILEVETGRITDVNPFLVRLLGFSRAEISGKRSAN